MSKSRTLKCLLLALLILLPFVAGAQKKVYTKKMKMEDFPVSTTKVVLSGEYGLDEALRESVIARWSINPFEFCSAEEYAAGKEKSDCYFLHAESGKEEIFLVLSKAGKSGDPNPMKQAFDVVKLPVAPLDSSSFANTWMPAFVDILQNYVEDALAWETYSIYGLKGYDVKIPKSKKVLADEQEAAVALAEGNSDFAVGLAIGRYYMIFDADTHRLYKFGRRKNFDRRYGESD